MPALVNQDLRTAALFSVARIATIEATPSRRPCVVVNRMPFSLARRFSVAPRTCRRLSSLAFEVARPHDKLEDGSEAPPIILLHGLFGSKKNYRSFSKCVFD